MTALDMSEADWQRQVTELMQVFGWRWLHVRKSIGRRDGKRAVQTTTNLKGWPDLLAWHEGRRRVIAAELKSERGVVSPEQTAVLASLEDQSVQSVITSPPYWQQKRYLPMDHPLASKEIGQEGSPAEFLTTMLRLTDNLFRVIADDGTAWVNLGDTSSGSGGSGGDFNAGGRKADQAKYMGSARAAGQHGARVPWKGKRDGHPPAKSLCFIPHLFGASLAYGRNLLTGEPCEQWVVRNVITWCKPSINPGRCDDRFRRATELMIFAAKGPQYYWDKAAILKPLADSPGNRYVRKVSALDAERRPPGLNGRSLDNRATADHDPADSEGAPPFDWWKVSTSSYDGAHYATMPPDLIVDPVLASCPPGGTILDPFGGSGTTALVATGHGRNCISIDFDERNADLARERVGMFLTVEDERPRPVIEVAL